MFRGGTRESYGPAKTLESEGYWNGKGHYGHFRASRVAGEFHGGRDAAGKKIVVFRSNDVVFRSEPIGFCYWVLVVGLVGPGLNCHVLKSGGLV